jgi:menaquinone-dependent protoporphyrinogen IX oxidase
MKKTAIFYKSYLGSTKKYAQWLSIDINADLFTFKAANKVLFNRYDQIVIASGTYAGTMPLTSFIKKHWPDIKNKKVIVLSIGISPPEENYTIVTLEKIPQNIRKKVTIHRLPGAIFGKTPPETGEVTRDNLKPIIKSMK